MERRNINSKLATYFEDIGMKRVADSILLPSMSDNNVIKDEWTLQEKFVKNLGVTLSELPPPTSALEPTSPRVICNRKLNKDDFNDVSGFIFDNGVKLRIYELSKNNSAEQIVNTLIHVPQEENSNRMCLRKCVSIRLTKLRSGAMKIYSGGWNLCVKKLSLEVNSKITILEYPNGSLTLLKEEEDGKEGQKKRKPTKQLETGRKATGKLLKSQKAAFNA